MSIIDKYLFYERGGEERGRGGALIRHPCKDVKQLQRLARKADLQNKYF